MCWLDSFQEGERLKVKIRFQHKGSWAQVFSIDRYSLRVQFEEPQRACTPGQSAVIYRDSRLVGGGRICPMERVI